MLNLQGKQSGRLTVLNFSGKNKWGVPIWKCLCSCGNITKALSGDLTFGHIKSCGCLQKERTSKANTTHGGSYSRLHKIWRSMKQRCLNERNSNYKNYGGRGVRICPKWKHHFVLFRSWALNNGYTESLTIDRINNDGNYEPSNCQFITRSENAKKTRRNINAFTRKSLQKT